VWRIPVDGAPPVQLAEGDRPRGVRLSASGRWVAFYLAFESDPTRDGLWIVGSGGGAPRRLEAFGSYRWGSPDLLFLVPLAGPHDSLSLAAYDPATAETQVIRPDDAFPGGIAANDWSVSPDGRWAAYRSAADAALWVVPLRSD